MQRKSAASARTIDKSDKRRASDAPKASARPSRVVPKAATSSKDKTKTKEKPAKASPEKGKSPSVKLVPPPASKGESKRPSAAPPAEAERRTTTVRPVAPPMSERPRMATVPPPPPLPSIPLQPILGNGRVGGIPQSASKVVAKSSPPPAPTRESTPPTSQPVFRVGDRAVHPQHGVGEITAVDERDIGGTRGLYYIMKILDRGMTVMIPVGAALQVGLRSIMSPKDAEAILETMRAREVAVDVQPWSRRFRIYTEMIKSGSPVEVAKVLRDMNRLKFDKDLSFGERRLLDTARSLLMKELAFAKRMTEGQMSDEVKRIFAS